MLNATASKTVCIALLGNPNTGKTTLFNNLTGLKQRTGNYPGVTVTKKIGTLQLKDNQAEIIDLPGTYSLSANSPDEKVVLDVLSGKLTDSAAPDLAVCVADAATLRRSLLLVSQIADLGIPLVLVINQWDSLKKAGLTIDVERLQKQLGVPVVSATASKGIGTAEIKTAIEQVIEKPARMKALAWPTCVNAACSHLQEALKRSHVELSNHEIQRLLFDVHSGENTLPKVDSGPLKKHIQDARQKIQQGGFNPLAAEALLHYRHIDTLLEGVIQKQGEASDGQKESIDAILLHRGWGLAIFIGMMYLVFQSVYTWAGPLMDGMEFLKTSLQGFVAPMLASTPMLQSLVTDGIIEGVGAFLVFLPQILILFFFIALLEDTGYMARAAFLMDKLFSGCGLNGKSFVPLMSSYACAIPGIMAARTIEDPKTRLTTIFVAPFMSCSARLPVYILLIGTFIEPKYGPMWAGFTLFAMHFVGLAVAIPTAWVLTRFILKTKSQPFVMELPRYRIPRLRDVSWRMAESGLEFCKRAGSIIFAITVIVWALLYFPRLGETERNDFQKEYIASLMSSGTFSSEEAIVNALEDPESEVSVDFENAIASEQMNQSFMSRIGKTIQPIFAPAGYDWKITVGVLASFPAREVIVSTLGIIYRIGGDVDEESGDLREALAVSTWSEGSRAGQPIFTIPVILSLMIFYALCSQCGATVAVIVKEAGSVWAILSFFYMTGLAWVGAVLTYQIGTLLM